MASKRKCSLPEGEEQSKCAKKSYDKSKTDDRIYAFRVMLDKLGQHLDATHVQRIANLEDLSTREKGEIQNSPAALFQLLESKQKLNVNDVSRLEENLFTINHMAAVKLLDEYQHHEIDDFPPEPDYDDAEDDHNRTVTFDDILKMLGLEDKFPGKLQLEDFLRVRCTVDSTQTVYSFWQKITCLDYRAGLPQSHSMTPRVQYSMRDFIFAVLHCSDHFLRQDILEKMSACQLAVPVLLSGIKWKKQPIFLRWACRRILKKWKGEHDLFAIEQPIISHSIFTVSVLRIGEIGMSKSQILNHMVGPCQGSGAHPYFLTNEWDTVSPKFSLGSIESIWFLPTSANKTEIFKNAMAFLNLRGDCAIHPTQREFACTAANLTIVFVPTDERQNFVEVIRDVKKKSCQTLFISVKDTMGSVEQLQHEKNWTFVKGLHVDTLSKYICQEIETICDKNDGKISSLCDFDAQNVDIDENITHIKTAESAVNNIFHNAKDQDVIQFKNENFKLQQAWKKLIQLDKERFSFDNQDGTTFEQKLSKDKAIIKEYREAQLQCQLSESVQCYLNSVKNVSDQETYVKYFLGILHDKIFQIVCTNTHVDMKTICKLEEKLRQYKTSLPETGNCDDQTGHQGRALKDYESSVEEFNKLNASCKVKNLGCEHFLREIGLQYEAYEAEEARCVSKTLINSSEFTLYPSIAAQLILEMHSFELMDGDTGCVPITWVTAVLDELTKKLSNPKVLVLSVIGVQSSGKSTLLNSMFGLRFPVRAGRCTRGLFIRLLKVDKIMAAKLGFDYLIVVDTEGLRSIDHDDHRFDNELVTFALSISNVGIFNIGGENIGHDMVGVLQIAAHALMRMKEVDLKSTCKIVQQRVSDITSADMNKSNTNIIKVTLDEATRYAAEEEGLEGRYSQFSDVVDLRVDVDIQTIPCLWTGGMSPPNPLYAEKVAKIREGLFDDIKTQKITTELTLSTFTERVRNVWKAVKEENFIFNFQDSVRAVDFNQLCLHYNEWLIQMRQLVREKSEEVLTMVSIESEDLKSLIEKQIEKSKETLKKKLNDYLTNHERRNIILKHRQNFLDDIDMTMKEVKNQTVMRLTEEIDIRNLERNPPKLNGEWLVKAIIDVNQIVPQIRVEIGEEPLHSYNQHFQKYLTILWSKWTKDIKKESDIIIRTLNLTDLQRLCEKLLLRVTRDMAVGSEIKNLLTHEGGIENHLKLPDCLEYINEKYLKVWISHKEMSKKRDYLSEDTRDQQSVEQDLNIQHKSRIVEAFVRSVISSRISEMLRERKKSFDSNLFQLMVRKALLELSTKSDGIKLPPTLIAKILLHLSSKSVKDVFFKAHVCDFRDFYGDEENFILSHLLHVINNSDPAVSAANFIYHFIKAALTKQDDLYNISKVHQIKRVQLPWDLLEFMSSNHIDQHQYMYGIDTSLVMPRLSAIVNSYAMHQCFIISNKLSNVLRNSMTKKLVTLEQTHSIGSYKEWTEGLVRECKIDPCIVSTDELFHEPNFILVSKYLQRNVAQWKSDVIINVSHIQVPAGLTYVCDKTCPMCGVFCDNVMESHQIHSSHLHRPRGMKGETYSGSNHLVLEDCNVSISLPTASFTNTFGNITLCKCYKESFPDWKIQPFEDYPGKQFWQWVFASNSNIFAGVYGKSTEKIPKHWYTITKETALQSLQVDKSLKTQGRRSNVYDVPWGVTNTANYDLPINDELLKAVPGTSRSGEQ